jgi:hypothetical protein
MTPLALLHAAGAAATTGTADAKKQPAAQIAAGSRNGGLAGDGSGQRTALQQVVLPEQYSAFSDNAAPEQVDSTLVGGKVLLLVYEGDGADRVAKWQKVNVTEARPLYKRRQVGATGQDVDTGKSGFDLQVGKKGTKYTNIRLKRKYHGTKWLFLEPPPKKKRRKKKKKKGKKNQVP